MVAVGSHDFEAYQSALYRAKFRDGDERSEAQLLADLQAIDGQQSADVTLISLSNGDRTAHAYGTHSPRYHEAFRAIDRLIAQIVARAGDDSDILVFGDHGHDEMGRHLPGLPSTTVAVYAGPSFRGGVRSSATLTDHRAMLGVLLGVPTPPSYLGPELSGIFAPAALSADQLRRLPALRAQAVHQGPRAMRLVLACLTLGGALVVAQKLLQSAGLSAGMRWVFSLLGVALLAFAGRYYDALRQHIHDHGSEPIRSFWLLVPLALGFGLGFVRRGASGEVARWPGTRSVRHGAALVRVAFSDRVLLRGQSRDRAFGNRRAVRRAGHPARLVARACALHRARTRAAGCEVCSGACMV